MANKKSPSVEQGKYRKDIDGLRAIAVLLVIFYHLNFAVAPSGFLGVDIFFVISGFLITSHIFSELTNETFSIKIFYLKRMRRILPALNLVLIVTTIAALVILLPSDLRSYKHSLLATQLSLSNIYFAYRIKIGYFSTDATILPLLHTWSLGVEEQFYIIWPIILLALSRIIALKKIIYIAAVMATCSFLGYYLYQQNTQFIFYSPLTRAFELLFGGILALHGKPKYYVPQYLPHMLSLTGLILIITASCILPANAYPSANILLPITGATILIWSGNYNGIINRLLSLRFFQGIGLISYSLYLWHWPFIAYSNYLGINLTYTYKIIIIMLSLLLSYLSWQYVEKPFRFKYKFKFKKTFILFWLLPIILGTCFYMTIKLKPNIGFNEISETAQKAINNGYFGFINPNSHCHNSGEKASILGSKQRCAVGNRALRDTSVLITGDSHAMSEMGMLNIFLNAANLKAYIATKSSGPFILLDDYTVSTVLANDLKERNTIIKQLIQNQKYKYVVLGASWSEYQLTQQQLKQGLTKTISFIEQQQATPVIVLDFPPLFNTPIRCGVTRINLVNCYNNKQKVNAYQKDITHAVSELKELYPNIIIIDPSKVICQNNRCVSNINGIPLYFTGKTNSHLNFSGSTIVGEQYIQKYGNPFQPK